MNKNKAKTVAQPKKVKRLVCPKCGELQIKIYPFSSIQAQEGQPIPVCQKCLAKAQ